jgi:transposase
MSSIIDNLTQIYGFVTDFTDTHPNLANWRRSHNNRPAFTDAEVLTIALMQSVLGVATLKQTYRLVADNGRGLFPYLCSYAQWLSRLHALSALTGHLIAEAIRTHDLPGCLYLLDSKPIPVCKPIRHGRVRLLREDGAYFGKSSTGGYFGFKLHTLVHHTGAILYAMLTPANCPDKDADVLGTLLALAAGGVVLVDLGYRDQALLAQIEQEYDVMTINPAQAGTRRALISSLRERVETTFSGLWNRFVDRVFSRSWQGLWSAILLKMLHYNLCLAGRLQ